MSEHQNPNSSQQSEPSNTDESLLKEYLADLRRENNDFYSDPRGKGALKDLQQTFPHPWLYVAELLQNAIDEGATRVSILIEGDDKLIFEHNGNPFTHADVKSLCVRGVSSKGAGTVGFMGVGFKAIFRSYENVQVVSAPWTFSLVVSSVKGERFGDLQRDWMGAVLPQWDGNAAPPSSGMTCRFVLSGRLPGLKPIQDDLDRLFGEDKTLLALLAWRGVTELNWNGDLWVLNKTPTQLGHDGDTKILLEALDESCAQLFRWMMFELHYQPSVEAIKRFLEHRQLDPAPEVREKVYAEASRPRQVALFVKLSDDDTPLPVPRGSAFALLPTGVTLPLGVHVQADWLLVISRQEIMQIEGNEWHEGILRQIPRLLRHYLSWVVSNECGGDWEKGYDALPGSYREDNEADRWFRGAEFRQAFTDEIHDLEFLPLPSADEDTIDFLTPSEARILPEPLAVTFDKPSMKHRLLFGDQVISTRFLGERASTFLSELKLIGELTPAELTEYWDDGAVGEWVTQFAEGERYKLLAQLLGSLANLDDKYAWREAALVCLPTEAGTLTYRSKLSRFPSDWNVFAQEEDIRSALEVFLGTKDVTLALEFDNYIIRVNSPALRYVERVVPPKMDDVVSRWWDSLPDEPDATRIELVLKFTSWVRGKQQQRKSLVQKLLCVSQGDTLRLLPTGDVLLTDPYAGNFRRSFFSGLPVVAPRYLDQPGATNADWRSFFESLPQAPKGSFKLSLIAKKMGWWGLKEKFGQDYLPPATRSSSLTKPWRGLTVENNSYQLLDAHLPEEVAVLTQGHRVEEILIKDFSSWVLESPSTLREFPTLILAYIPSYQSYVTEDRLPYPASWVKDLTDHEWVFTTRGEGPFLPRDVLAVEDPVRPDAPVSALPAQFTALLQGAGISFGEALPDAPAIERLKVQGPQSDPVTLLELMSAAFEEAGDDAEKVILLRQVLSERPLFPIPSGVTPVDGATRVSCARIVRSQRGRSTLSDWVISTERFRQDSPEREALEIAHTLCAQPVTTSADQVMDFLSWVWETKPDAERVRGVLSRAYQYLREDLGSDPVAAERWKALSRKAKVFITSPRGWANIEGNERVFLDDLNHPSLQEVTAELELATPGHLGAEAADQIATATLLDLKLLSTRFSVEVRPGTELTVPEHWQRGFDFIQGQLRERLDDAADEVNDEGSSVSGGGKILRLSRWQSIRTLIYDEGSEAYSAPSAAALLSDTVAVSGEPREFAKELCRVLCDYWGLRRRHDLPEILPELAIRVTEISDPNLVASWTADKTKLDAEETEEAASPDAEIEEQQQEQEPSNVDVPIEHPTGDVAGEDGTDHGHPTEGGQAQEPRPKRNRLLSYVAPHGATYDEPPDSEAAERRSQIDEAGVARVKQYEESSGREPDVMPHHNEGYDIKSYDEDGRLARYIEVKSLSGGWDVDNVKMTHSQFEYAVEIGERYWLYVVERAEHEDFKIHTIQNPARQVMYFVFDHGWEAMGANEEPGGEHSS